MRAAQPPRGSKLGHLRRAIRGRPSRLRAVVCGFLKTTYEGFFSAVPSSETAEGS
jgi:hypothetical protein